MIPSSNRSILHQAGFTLVEIMVGLAIGMLATLVIMQVFSVFETQKRATTGTADAQTNGGIALYNIGRELQIAGYPLMPAVNSPLECTALNVGGIADVPNRLTPVAITDGPSGTSDTITIRYGNSRMGGVPTQITAMGTPTANDATVNNNFGCQSGDIAIAISADGLTCNMTSVTALSAAGVTPASITLANAVTGAELACLGTWNEITYAAINDNLERTAAPGASVPTVAGIVNLQAQYGISATANSNQVTQWVDASAAAGWNAPTVADRNRIKAVRIAVVARNAKREPDSITSPTLTVWNGGPMINLSAEERHYRYRVFETIIPLRNVIWSRDTL